MSNHLSPLFPVALLFGAITPMAQGQGATFEALGNLSPTAPMSIALAIAADGSVVVGTSIDTDAKAHAVRWGRTGGSGGSSILRSDPDPLPDLFESIQAVAVSADGSRIACNLWEGPSCSTPYTISLPSGHTDTLSSMRCNALARAVSSDAVVGEFYGATSRGLRWDVAGGGATTFLPTPPQYTSASVVAVTNDGRIAVGESQGPSGARATVWRDGRDPYFIGEVPATPPFYHISRCTAISEFGGFIVGEQYRNLRGPDIDAFMYSVASEELVVLGALPPGQKATPTAVNNEGTVIVGCLYTQLPTLSRIAFIWRRGEGIENLQTVLAAEHGLDLQGWTLISANGLSRNSREIVGEGINPQGNTQAWRASLPAPQGVLCIADFDESGGVDGADVEAFFIAWSGNDERADANQDGGVDGQDVEAFFIPWEAGGC